MIALILGGAPSVWADLAEAQALLGRRHIIVAANLAGIHHKGPLHAWASLHPDLFTEWRAQRKGPAADRYFAPAGPRTPGWADQVEERWPGSSGLYAAQVSLLEMGASGAVLCGIPMERSAGHFTDPGAAWADTADYQRAFASALPEIGGRVRSMGGWTQDMFGRPTTAWIDAIDFIRPLGVTRPQHEARPMHHVKNVSDETQPFSARGEDGDHLTVRLAPGEAGHFDINPHQGSFQTGALKVTAPSVAQEPGSGAKPKAPRKPRTRKTSAKKA
jgi:hypothetical protein